MRRVRAAAMVPARLRACDDGNTQDGDYCASDCGAITTVCGDGLTQGDELCDDGAGNTDGYAAAESAMLNVMGTRLIVATGL